MSAIRITSADLDTIPPVKARKPRAARKPTVSSAPSNKQRHHLTQLEKWSARYVVAAIALSSCLNCWANVDIVGSESIVQASAAGLLGAIVPVLVWLLFRSAGHAYRGGQSTLAKLVGAAGVVLLVLSVWHCAHAIAVLTGDHWLVLSVLMALGIDYGLVASEVASILAHQTV